MKLGPVPFIAKDGTIVTPEGYNENVRKTADYFNDITAYKYVYSTITYPLHNIELNDPWWKRSWAISPPGFGEGGGGSNLWTQNFGVEIASVHMVVFNAATDVDYSADWITTEIGTGVSSGLCEPISVNTQEGYTGGLTPCRNTGNFTESVEQIVMPGGASSDAGLLKWVTAKTPVASTVAEGISQKVYDISKPPLGGQKYYAFKVNGEYASPGEMSGTVALPYGYLNVTIRCKKYLSPNYLAPAGSKTGETVNASNLNEAFERPGTGLNARKLEIRSSEKQMGFVKCMVMSSKMLFDPGPHPKGIADFREASLIRAIEDATGDTNTSIVGLQVGIAAESQFTTVSNGPPRSWPWFTATAVDAGGVPALTGEPYVTASQQAGFYWGFGTTDFWANPPVSGNYDMSALAPVADPADAATDYGLRWGFELYDTLAGATANEVIDHFYIYVWYR